MLSSRHLLLFLKINKNFFHPIITILVLNLGRSAVKPAVLYGVIYSALQQAVKAKNNPIEPRDSVFTSWCKKY